MSNATPSRLGQINQSGDAKALFLKVFPGEIINAFKETNVMMDKHLIRTIQYGKSATFPINWKFDAAYHTPGTRLLGAQKMNHNERVIFIDELLVADTFVSNFDEAMNHYDVRSVYSRELGSALSRAFDKRALQVAVLTARASANVSGGFGGTALTNAAYGTNGATLAAGIFAAAQTFDEKDVPAEDRNVFLKPAQYYLLAQNTTILDKDWGGVGSYSEANVIKVAGISIVKTNNLPTTNIAAVSGENNTYSGDFSTTVGVATHRSAIGTVKLMDLSMEQDYMIDLQGTLMVAKYAMGTGRLRPEAAVELKTA